MSRTGWSTSNFLRNATAIVTGTPLTISAWAWTDSNSVTAQMICSIVNSASTTNLNAFHLALSGGNIQALAADGTNDTYAAPTATHPLNTWFHACGVYTSATSRAAYLNGGNKGTNTGSRTPSGLNRTSIGKRDNATGDRPFSSTGFIAEVAIWNDSLTDAEVASLATGISPFKIRPSALVAYWPLIGNTSPEVNLVSTATQTVQGTLSAAAHPRVIMPPRQGIVV